MWNNTKFNGMLNNQMNNMYNYNNYMFNNQFINSYNQMNNSMFFNNNNNYPLYNNTMPFGNFSQITMNPNFNMFPNNYNQMLNKSHLIDKINIILNSNDTPKKTQEEEQIQNNEVEEDGELSAALRDVINEPTPQKQNYENQNIQNLNYT